MIIAAIPVKDLVNAKQRLMRTLDSGQRLELARAMLRDVLRAFADAGLDAVWVITRDAGVTAIAHAFGAEVLHEKDNRGHTAAVALAQNEALRRRGDVFVTVPGDVPCVTADEIAALARAGTERRPAAVFVPSRSGLGTNGAALAPPDAMALRFGEPSFANHLAAARARGLIPRVLEQVGLGLDIDGPDDVRALLADGGRTESRRLLAGWRIADRLTERPAGAPR